MDESVEFWTVRMGMIGRLSFISRSSSHNKVPRCMRIDQKSNSSSSEHFILEIKHAGLKRQNNHTSSDSVFIFRAESVNHINKRVTPNLGQKCQEERLARQMMISCTGTGPNLHLRKRRLETSEPDLIQAQSGEKGTYEIDPTQKEGPPKSK